MSYYTDGKHKAFLRSRYKDTDGTIILIVGWKDGATPSICPEKRFLSGYREITKEEYDSDVDNKAIPADANSRAAE